MTESVLDADIRNRPVTWSAMERIVDRLRAEIHGSRALPQDAERALPALLTRAIHTPPEHSSAAQMDALRQYAKANKARLAYNHDAGRWEAKS